jgi:nitrate reductase assembly molybdenum cofactor insertion protein NarJ
MAHTHVSAEVSSLLLQAKAFLHDARRMRPGPARDELREVAKVLREMAKLEAQSNYPTDLDQPDNT